MKISGQIVDPKRKEIYPGEVIVENGHITAITERSVAPPEHILPGLIDAHIHIESSMLTPAAFAALAVLHGTVATVSDPHEIGNVLGVKGVDFMIENGNTVPFKFYFGAPSCVPATSFETSGAVIGPEDIDLLLKRPQIKYLSEMMNYPGVLNKDEIVWKKIQLAHQYKKPIDGHAPGLRGSQAQQYISAGISTDHECFTYEEALDKITAGMNIIIREGSAAKNFDALIDLLPLYPEKIMFCSDDKHPDELIHNHIDQLVRRALAKGIDIFHIIQAVNTNPINHYKLEVGSLQIGDPADFIVVDNLGQFNVLQTFIEGEKVAENKESFIPRIQTQAINHFTISKLKPEHFQVKGNTAKVRAIKALDGQLITEQQIVQIPLKNNYLLPDPEQDTLKIAVVNRYKDADVKIGFITNFGLKEGAIASCVAHDSHNIIAVGINDQYLSQAVNLIIDHQGGISAVGYGEEHILPLPIAGIMSDQGGKQVGEAYATVDAFAKKLGSKLSAPFMTLSFMGLLVIPSLKMSDLGLFDGNSFAFTSLEIEEA